MIPDADTFREACPDVDEAVLQEYLARLGRRYFQRFSRNDLFRHLRCLAGLTPEHPVAVLLEPGKDDMVACTILAFDYPSEFSLIAGILAGSGFSVVTGDVFTYGRPRRPSRSVARAGRRRGRVPPARERRKIIDHFSGMVHTAMSFKDWAVLFRKDLETVMRLLERGDEASVDNARDRVNEMVIRRLARFHPDAAPVLYPVRVDIRNESNSPWTRLKVVSEDTPAFLYALSTALSLHGVSIEHIRIRTIHGRIEDEIDLVDARGRRIEDPGVLDRIRLSALLTKEFTYFLGNAPDPHAALSRFEHIVREVLDLPARGDWIDLLSNSLTLQRLARLLGTSDYLWEDFIRQQYETLLPMLEPHVGGHRFSGPEETLGERMSAAVAAAGSLEEKCERMNAFKDREIFLIELDHILTPHPDPAAFSRSLTRLAELVVNTAVNMVFEDLARRFGRPRTADGAAAAYAVFGLGKLGSAALGYASDMEILFVYSDNGETDGKEPIGSAEFFERLIKGATRSIRTKREGIFRVDMRLRPFGSSGPMACSLENFRRYYGKDGPAHAYERLALVRLRAIGGDPDLGVRLERLRDEMVYSAGGVDVRDVLALRERQYREKAAPGGVNAKYGPGCLVDLEYGVQLLQVLHGADIPALRTPLLHEALRVLSDKGILSPEEAFRLPRAYDFFRRLINGMRMLRGSADDLHLPPADAVEFTHLARRAGYAREGALDPGQQLHIDFEAHTAAVRAFIRHHFGGEALPDPRAGSVADLVLSDQVEKGLRSRILSGCGFRKPERAFVNLKGLAGGGSRRETFSRLAVLAFDILSRGPDPDMALNNWERFIRSVSSAEFHFKTLFSQPMLLELILAFFSGSQFLSDTLVRNPGFLDWVTIPEILHRRRDRRDLEDELKRAAAGCARHGEWLNKLRRLRRREILRIGARDLFLHVSDREVMEELSLLAEAFVRAVLEKTWEDLQKKGTVPEESAAFRERFCVMALGKLGGGELNYSSDIDLLGVFRRPAPEEGGPSGGKNPKRLFARVMERIRSDLSAHTEEGYAYRVDLRLRPFGGAGDMVPEFSRLVSYYRKHAALWELQAALKMRPVAGNLTMGYDLLRRLRPVLLVHRDPGEIVAAIERMRRAAVRRATGGGPDRDIKSGVGGLRDIEFLVQGLQLLHAPENEALLEGNTLLALEALRDAGILPEAEASRLKADYIFLRRTEHHLQLMEDRQVHALPGSRMEIEALAKRVLGPEGNGEDFVSRLDECRRRVRGAFVTHLLEQG